jgi:hypothetical protein
VIEYIGLLFDSRNWKMSCQVERVQTTNVVVSFRLHNHVGILRLARGSTLTIRLYGQTYRYQSLGGW